MPTNHSPNALSLEFDGLPSDSFHDNTDESIVDAQGDRRNYESIMSVKIEYQIIDRIWIEYPTKLTEHFNVTDKFLNFFI